MPKLKLTHRGIAGLEPSGEWLTDYMDEGLPNFGVRAHHSGLKVFFVRYTGEDGKRRRIKIGPYPTYSLAEARDRAKEIIGRIARGEDWLTGHYLSDRRYRTPSRTLCPASGKPISDS